MKDEKEPVLMDFEEFKHQEFIHHLQSCNYCQRFGIEPKSIVWGEKKAKIVQISQEPSKSVSESGIPFWDASGRKLIKSGMKLIEWYDIGDDEFLNPNFFYITGMAHCYSKGKEDVRRACAEKWLKQELSFLDPRLYIIIGKPAADFLFGKKEYLCEHVFEDLELNNKQAFVLPHPSGRSLWFNNNQNRARFEDARLNDIRNAVHDAITS